MIAILLVKSSTLCLSTSLNFQSDSPVKSTTQIWHWKFKVVITLYLVYKKEDVSMILYIILLVYIVSKSTALIGSLSKIC